MLNCRKRCYPSKEGSPFEGMRNITSQGLHIPWEVIPKLPVPRKGLPKTSLPKCFTLKVKSAGSLVPPLSLLTWLITWIVPIVITAVVATGTTGSSAWDGATIIEVNKVTPADSFSVSGHTLDIGYGIQHLGVCQLSRNLSFSKHSSNRNIFGYLQPFPEDHPNANYWEQTG